MAKIETFTHPTLTSNTYLIHLVNCDDCWLVDAGSGREVLSSLGQSKNITAVFLTHSHYDHIYDLSYILEEFPEIDVYCSSFCAKGLSDPKLNLSFYHEEPITIFCDRIRVVNEGDCIRHFTGVNMYVFHTPGHNPGCLSFGFLNYLFTGDSYIPGIPTITKLKGGDRSLNKETVSRIKNDLIKQFRTVMPGHNIEL